MLESLEERKHRLLTEAQGLQETIKKHGFVPGKPTSVAELKAKPEAFGAQMRLWYIGFAIHNPNMPA